MIWWQQNVIYYYRCYTSPFIFAYIYHGNEIGRHLHRRLEIVPWISRHTFTKLVMIWNIILRHNEEYFNNSWHGFGSVEWHVADGRHRVLVTHSDGVNGFHVGLVETRESSSGVRRFKLGNGQVSVKTYEWSVWRKDRYVRMTYTW